MDDALRKAIDAIWRIESPKLTGALTRLVRDVGWAHDLAHEACVAALERWPSTGIPENPGAWLMTTAKHRAIDEHRRRQLARKRHELEGSAEATFELDVEASLDRGVADDVLRLMLVACHPILATEARVALTLRMLAGLSTEEIARAFLVTEPTIAQRIVRAKRTLAEARVPFEVPRGDELAARVTSVCEVVYLTFNEGYAATRGDDWIRTELCDEALRLARILAAHVPDDAEVQGLLALLEIQSSRARARVGADGEPVLLFDQDRSRWDRMLIARGLAALARSEALRRPLGPYALQAAIAACHARAQAPEETDWRAIVALYDALAELTGSPVVELNRAVAVGMAFGPAEGLDLVDQLADAPALAGYHLLPSVRGDLLMKLGRHAEARRELERAAFMTTNVRERALLLKRAKSLQGT